MIVHVVLVRWKESTTPSQASEAKTTFLNLVSKISGLTGAYWGESEKGSSDGFAHGVVVMAEDPAALEAYHAHPDHHHLSTLIGTLASNLSGANLQA